MDSRYLSVSLSVGVRVRVGVSFLKQNLPFIMDCQAKRLFATRLEEFEKLKDPP